MYSKSTPASFVLLYMAYNNNSRTESSVQILLWNMGYYKSIKMLSP